MNPSFLELYRQTWRQYYWYSLKLAMKETGNKVLLHLGINLFFSNKNKCFTHIRLLKLCFFKEEKNKRERGGIITRFWHNSIKSHGTANEGVDYWNNNINNNNNNSVDKNKKKTNIGRTLDRATEKRETVMLMLFSSFYEFLKILWASFLCFL